MTKKFYKKTTLIIWSVLLLLAIFFLPSPASANHDSCGNPGMSGGPQRYERCVTSMRDNANERCFTSHESDNDAIAACVTQVNAHFDFPGLHADAPALPAEAQAPTGGNRVRTPVDSCSGGGFFGFPKWYKYLRGEEQQNDSFDTRIGKTCEPVIGGIKDVLLIGAAFLEILLRIAVLLAIGLVVWGGIQFVIGQGEPDRVSAARSTIVNAVIGLVVAIAATAVISFIAGRFVSS